MPSNQRGHCVIKVKWKRGVQNNATLYVTEDYTHVGSVNGKTYRLQQIASDTSFKALSPKLKAFSISNFKF